MFIGNTSIADVLGNSFLDSGSGAAGSEHIDFISGTSATVRLMNNRYATPAGMTLIAVQKEVAHTFTASTNKEANESLGGLNSFFVAASTDRNIVVRVHRNANQAITTGSQQVTVVHDTVDEDNTGGFAVGTGLFTVPVAGMYAVAANTLCDF
jgi:hypothetical protein